jgi:hypothetical protein
VSGDEISLTLPADDAFHRVAHLVLGGLAVRLDLSYEHLEDLELALDALLERSQDDAEVTVRCPARSSISVMATAASGSSSTIRMGPRGPGVPVICPY